ncbi:MAG TPA: HPF/RaiA family ribosome-associated protein [Acidobacteriaceae bacterium]|nr:HPF/RaiA family ribosome-associated protein [Acidobacteriaceae bacterium]
MKIQVNSDHTIAVDVSLTHFVEGEVSRLLGRFATRLTRVEVHLSDVDNKKTGQADKRCLIEARPKGAQPRSVSTKAKEMSSAVDEAIGKMQRSLTTFFGRRGRPAAAISTPASAARKTAARKTVAKKSVAKKAVAKKVVAKKVVARKTTIGTRTSVVAKKAPVAKSTKHRARGPKKKRIYQARRKPWPTR